MDIGNWLTLAAVITTLLAPLLQNYHNRMLQRGEASAKTTAPASSKSYVGNQIERLAEWVRKRKLPMALPIVGVIVAASSLIVELSRTGPITRTTILAIAVPVAAIYYQLAMLLIIKIVYGQGSTQQLHGKIIHVLEHLMAKNSSQKDDQAA
jgi:hypothetical protein